MPRQRGRQNPTLNTEENSSQGKKTKKHLPACGKPPQTSAGKHKGCEVWVLTHPQFLCSPAVHVPGADQGSQDLPGLREVQGTESWAQTQPWTSPAALVLPRMKGWHCLEGHRQLRDAWSSSAVCLQHLALGLPAHPGCQPDPKSVLCRDQGVSMPKCQPCRQQEPLPPVISQTQRGWGGAWRMGMSPSLAMSSSLCEIPGFQRFPSP